MPSGKTHDRITLVTAPLVAYGTYLSTQSGDATALITGSFVFAGLMFSGDLDIRSVQTNRWGLFSFIWLPYRKFGHRSKWTHGVLRGTLFRILYLFAWVTLGIYLLSLHPKIDFTVTEFLTLFSTGIKENPTYVIHILIGLLLGAFSHTAADVTVSYFKRKIQKFKKWVKRKFSFKRKRTQKNYGTKKSRRR